MALTMERRESAIRLDDAVDQNGVARYEASSWQSSNDDSNIAPWLDVPPTPPPKSPSTYTRNPGFTPKASFASLVSRGSSSRGGSESHNNLHVPPDVQHRQLADDSESFRTIAHSSSSTNSGEHRKPKLSFFKLKRPSSKAHLRHDSDENAEHPSLRPPVPPLPEQRLGSFFNAVATASTPSLSIAPIGKKDKGKKKASTGKLPPSLPPKVADPAADFTGDFNLDSMDGIIDFNLASAGTSDPSSFSGTSGIGPKDPHSPGSYSDHSSIHHSHNHNYQATRNFIPHSEFIDPFSAADKRNVAVPPADYRKVSPKSSIPPYNTSRTLPPTTSSTSSSPEGSGNPWTAPASWVVWNGEDPYNSIMAGDLSEREESGSDVNSIDGMTLAPSRKSKKSYPASVLPSAPSATIARRISRPTLAGMATQPYPGFLYKMRIYRQNGEYHVVAISLETTVAVFSSKLRRKFTMSDDPIQHNLFLKEQGRERMLGAQECPAQIVKLRMEQAGYDFEDGQYLLGADSLNTLVKFVYKSQLLSGEEQVPFDNYDFVDLSGRGLRTIPILLHQHADSIISLRLSRNPMIDIPLDFIQSCTTLRELRLNNMSMKRVPQSLQHSTTLHRLDLSSNSIKDLEDAGLYQIHGLLAIFVQNNRLEKLPWYLPRLRHLTTLNISNNKFRQFPVLLTAMESLKDLDISFNMITDLPEDIGKINTLERFILVGNQVSRFPDDCTGLVNLRTLDCRRNQISDLSVVCTLPALTQLAADHNNVLALDLSLGPFLTTLDISHNDITKLSLVPGPVGNPHPYALTSLDLSYAKLSSLDDLALSHLASLRTLRLDHNAIRVIPSSLGDLKWLETLSCTDNKLDALPDSIGNLQKLEALDAHNNSLQELPRSLWNCASLMKINVTSNILGVWHDPPVIPVQAEESGSSGSLSPPAIGRKTSMVSLGMSGGGTTGKLPPLAYSLEKLYLGENCLTDNVINPIMIFKELRILNLSFNELQDLPPTFFRNFPQLEELYLSGNKLTSIPTEDLPKMNRLSVLFLNGNRLHTLPQELGKVKGLQVLDVGSNLLRYNINNWEFDWNWNFNTNLKYLNLSGNKKLQIKSESRTGRTQPQNFSMSLSSFTGLQQLRVLGLMDVTLSTAKDATIDIPDDSIDRRIRTSLSTVCGMGYGIADSLGKNDHLTMLDLVHEFHGRKGEAIFAMFGRTHPARHLKPGSFPNKLSKFLHDNFVGCLMTQLAATKARQEQDGVPSSRHRDGIPKALHWTFLKLNQELWNTVNLTPRKNSLASTATNHVYESQYAKVGASGIALYFVEKTIYAANAGDALAVVSRQGVCHEISRKHDPNDRAETQRIRAAEGFISPPGLVNDEVEVSRSFGYFNFFPPLNARPDIFVYDLTEMDEFVIVANRGLWDYVPYQTAVDIARTVMRDDRPDSMLAAQKLRDFAISYGADGSTMIMVICVGDLFDTHKRDRQMTQDSLSGDIFKTKKKDEVRDRVIIRLGTEVPPPVGHVTLVFTDIVNSTHLWEANPGMPTAMRIHNHLLRRQLRFCGGYEVKTEGDAFMCAFPTTLSAVWFCLTIQVQLLKEDWPLEILESDDCRLIYDSDGRLIARGLSVRMGIHSGMPLCETDVTTHRMDYFGPMVNRSARINGCSGGGQITCSMDIVREINATVLRTDEETEYSKLQSPQAIEAIQRLGIEIRAVGEVKLKGIELPEILSVLYPSGLEGRHELKVVEEVIEEPLQVESEMQLGIPQMRELGLLCLRIEALSSGRVFKPFPERKGSVQSNLGIEEQLMAAASSNFYGDPNILLPSINDNSPDSELIVILDSLTTRIENAVAALFQRYHVPSPPQSKTGDALVKALLSDGALDEETMEYITSILHRL